MAVTLTCFFSDPTLVKAVAFTIGQKISVWNTRHQTCGIRMLMEINELGLECISRNGETSEEYAVEFSAVVISMGSTPLTRDHVVAYLVEMAFIESV